MQYNRTNGRGIGRRTYLKSLGVVALAPGVAGCQDAEAEERNGSAGDAESTMDENETQDTETEDGAATDAGEDDDSGDSEPDSASCDTLKSEFTAYDAAGTPFVFTFDYPGGWDQPDTQAGEKGSLGIDSIFGTSFEDSTGSNRAEFQIMQEYDAVTSIEGSDQLDRLLAEGDFMDRSYEELEIDFAGEPIRVAATFEDEANYHYQLYLPQEGSGDELGYYPVGFSAVLRSSGLCTDVIRELSEETLRSFRPNPDSTIDSFVVEEE